MPRGNRTGPRGDGSMSGRGAGYCAGNDRPGFASSRMGFGPGRGQGRGRGMGPGRGTGYGRGFREPDRYVPVYREPSPEDEKAYLEKMVNELEAELENVKARMNELNEEK